MESVTELKSAPVLGQTSSSRRRAVFSLAITKETFSLYLCSCVFVFHQIKSLLKFYEGDCAGGSGPVLIVIQEPGNHALCLL